MSTNCEMNRNVLIAHKEEQKQMTIPIIQEELIKLQVCDATRRCYATLYFDCFHINSFCYSYSSLNEFRVLRHPAAARHWELYKLLLRLHEPTKQSTNSNYITERPN